MENARRIVMPEEYVLIGSLMNSPSSEKSIMACFFLLNFISGHSNERTIHGDILQSRHLSIETGAKLKKPCHFSINPDCPAVWNYNAGENFKKCRFAGTILTDDAKNLTFTNLT